MAKTTTNSTTTAILLYLNSIGHFVWRNNTTGVYDPTKKIFRKPKGQLNGVADIIGMTNLGQFLSIEVKTGKDKQSESQVNFQQLVYNHNGIYLCVKTFDDFLAKFNKYFKKT